MLGCAKAAGFKTVGISLLDNKTVFREDFFDYMKALKEELDRQEMRCRDTHLPCYDIVLSSEITDEKMEKALDDGMIATSILGGEWASYHPRTAVNYDYSSEIAFEHNRESLKHIVETAEKYNVGVAIENLPVFPDAKEHIFYTSDPDDLCKIVDAFKSDKIAVCWDTSHANLMPFDQAEVIRKLGKRIVQTHLGSNYKERDDHALPIFGNVNWKNVMGAFKDIGYRYELNLEAVPVEKTFVPTYMKLAFESVTMLKEIFEEK